VLPEVVTTCAYFLGQGLWQASFNSLSVNGHTVVGKTAAIFDTGTTQILGDPDSITKMFEAISGAKPASSYDIGLYTSALCCVASQSITYQISTL
jgi:hypothetical protein